MSKSVLILVLSSDFSPYSEMLITSQKTWDSIEVEGCETIFYCSTLDNFHFQNTDKVKYFQVGNGLFDMGHKNLAVFEWALQNKYFDYVCRVNASCFVNKKVLVEYVQTLPYENVFCGAEVKDESSTEPSWFWGGCSFIFSRDVIQKFVDNKAYYDHDLIDDKSISKMIHQLGIEAIPAKSCTIDNMGDCWRLMVYGGGESFEFTDFNEIKKVEGQFLFRVKQDGKRWIDKFLMEELFKILQ